MDILEKQIPAVVEQKDGYIEITFSDQVPRGMIEDQVGNVKVVPVNAVLQILEAM